MRFTILSLFPEFFASPLAAGLMAKARERGILDVALVNPRDYTTDAHRTVDDRPYGGGPGMVMLLDPIAKALENVERSGGAGRMLMLSPKGRPLTQEFCRELAGEPALTLLCGRYEGIDQRIEELYPIEPVSLGDFVLNGGESAALCLMEAVARLLPEYMGHEGSGDEESFSAGLLEYPHYTRPPEFKGLRVPEVLSSGDHARIKAWRRERALEETLRRRPELLSVAQLSPADMACLRGLPRLRPGRNLNLALVHHPVLDREGKTGTVSLTNLDVHDISRVSRTYGLPRFYLVTPLEDQRELAERLTTHWLRGPGAASNPDRAEALSVARTAASVEEAARRVAARMGRTPRLVATSAVPGGYAGRGRRGGKKPPVPPVSWEGMRQWLREGPVLLLFGTGHGLAPGLLAEVDGVLPPVRFMDAYNHLSVRSAVSIVVDRLLGDAM